MEYDISKDLDFIINNTIDNINFSYIKKSKIHGFGLFSRINIHENTILGNLDGQVISWEKYDDLERNISNDIIKYKNYFFMEWNALNTKTLLVRSLRTKYSYINHSYTPNLKIEYNPIRIITLRKIKKDEELTLDYTKEPLKENYFNNHGKTYL
ncbi:SET domain-containing protein-lysine N-methyltransferase [Aliarcobacter butzleri]|uniref:SET domain-containing protein-lysine N-methyltransferase n=1 Tax=Aliarcobacter butzleri TaxID=28197 RepID=UPI0021B40AD8|nr:SET domain-containing protein [Aliarcobacter butzleri]MCT7586689.1 SET domain-containing protein [Aliarcobacter butzleri]